MIPKNSSDYFNALIEKTSAKVATHLSTLSYIFILTSDLFQILQINVIFTTHKCFYGEVKLKSPNGNSILSLNG